MKERAPQKYRAMSLAKLKQRRKSVYKSFQERCVSARHGDFDVLCKCEASRVSVWMQSD